MCVCVFLIPLEKNFELECADPVADLKIVFLDSTDFYGRITIYRLDLLGRVA